VISPLRIDRSRAQEGVAHGIPLEVPDVVATEIERTMADA
jgi:hypothetical protein